MSKKLKSYRNISLIAILMRLSRSRLLRRREFYKERMKLSNKLSKTCKQLMMKALRRLMMKSTCECATLKP